MENNSDIIENFMGVYPNAVSKEYCEKVIGRFDYIQETQGYASEENPEGKIWTRQGSEHISTIQKENDTYFLGGNSSHLQPMEDDMLMYTDMPLLREFWHAIGNCYKKYAVKYGGLDSIHVHKMSPQVRIQKYKPSQGYHVWHCEADNVLSSHRIIAVQLYLNTVEEGGETEFLYQKMRVPSVQGTLLLHPAAWTHMHRGNPPLKGNKYIVTTWLQYMDTVAAQEQLV